MKNNGKKGTKRDVQEDEAVVGVRGRILRVLEDDYITVYGLSAGLISYQSTLGDTITIPAVLVEKIDQ